MDKLTARLEAVLSKIEGAAQSPGAAKKVRLISVSKTQSAADIVAIIKGLHVRGLPPLIGENYVQEFKKKCASIFLPYEAHFIGHLQKNKARDAAKLFSCIETVDDVALAETLNKEASRLGITLSVFLQVNVSNDSLKAGVRPERARLLASEIAHKFPNVRVDGLMTITKNYENPEDARGDFRTLRDVSIDLNRTLPAPYISMGMSSDFHIAIEEGATHVRVGSAIFGERERALPN